MSENKEITRVLNLHQGDIFILLNIKYWVIKITPKRIYITSLAGGYFEISLGLHSQQFVWWLGNEKSKYMAKKKFIPKN